MDLAVARGAVEVAGLLGLLARFRCHGLLLFSRLITCARSHDVATACRSVAPDRSDVGPRLSPRAMPLSPGNPDRVPAAHSGRTSRCPLSNRPDATALPNPDYHRDRRVPARLT